MLVDGLDRLFVRRDSCLRDVISTIDQVELQLALVVDEDRRLLGTITDGDVRRGFLNGVTLDEPAEIVMNSMPLVAQAGSSEAAIESMMKRTSLRRIPLIDDDGIVVGLAVPRSEAPVDEEENTVVIMAGGLGTRLAELTKDRPKPMLPVGAKPMLETIVERFVAQGFERLLISVNYRAEMIESYFGDGSRHGARIEYLRESKRLGTAGALQYLPLDTKTPIIVVNADVLTTIDFRKMLRFHHDSKRIATMAVSYHDVQVPYGVIEMAGQQISSLVEKPVYRYFVNAGIYVLDPECLGYIPRGEYADMTTLFERLLADGRSASSYPIHEYWQDVGRPDDYQRANRDYGRVFDT